MMYRRAILSLVVAGVAAAAAGGAAFGQDTAAKPAPAVTGSAPATTEFLATIKKFSSDQIRTAIGATDEEWKVLEPRVQKVLGLSNEMRRISMNMGSKVSGFAWNYPEDNLPVIANLKSAMNELKAAMDDPNATPRVIADKLEAARRARAKARAELSKAEAELKELLTPKQEAILFVRETIQ